VETSFHKIKRQDIYFPCKLFDLFEVRKKV